MLDSLTHKHETELKLRKQ